MPAFKTASLTWKVMAGICLVYMKTGSRIGVGGRGEAFQYHIILTYHTKPFHVLRISPLNLYVDHSPLAVRFSYSFPLPPSIFTPHQVLSPLCRKICWATGYNTISFVCFVICFVFQGRLFLSRYHLRISLSRTFCPLPFFLTQPRRSFVKTFMIFSYHQ